MTIVSAAKPGVGGGVWFGPAAATLPTSAASALGTDFKSLGYVSDSGVTRTIREDSQTVTAWGGDVVAVLRTGKTETFQFTLIEPTNTDVLGIVFGNATGDLSTGITVKSTTDQRVPHAYVFNTILAEDVLQRIVIPNGIVTAIDAINYVDGAVIGFGITITSIADSSGVTAYEYITSAPEEDE